jgi:hypothetical protein
MLHVMHFCNELGFLQLEFSLIPLVLLLRFFFLFIYYIASNNKAVMNNNLEGTREGAVLSQCGGIEKITREISVKITALRIENRIHDFRNMKEKCLNKKNNNKPGTNDVRL